MKFSKILSSIAIGTFMMINQVSFAQFEGEVNINLHGYNDGTLSGTMVLDLYVTNERMLFNTENSINLLNGLIETNGILIRSDLKDIIIMTGVNEAIQFTKAGLEGAFSLISMISDLSNAKPSISYKYTNEVKTIQGFKTTELRIQNENIYYSVWLSDEIDINWGILSESWSNVPASYSGLVEKMGQELKSKRLPLQIQVTNGQETKILLEVAEIKKSRTAKDLVEMSEGLQLIDLQQIIMKAFMGN